MTVPTTVTAVTNTEIPKPRGKSVSFQASTNPSTLIGDGREKTWPLTDCSVVLKAMVTVAKSGAKTASEHTSSAMVAPQLGRSSPPRPRNRRRGRTGT